MAAVLTSCHSDGEPGVTEEELAASNIKLLNNRIKVYENFNLLRDSLVEDSNKLLLRMIETLDLNLNIINTLITTDFSLNTVEPLSINSAVSSTTPPFTINATLTDDMMLISSRSRFFTPKNIIKTRFKTTGELSVAWLRAVEFSDSICVYVSLQSINAATGAAISISNILVVPLGSADQCLV